MVCLCQDFREVRSGLITLKWRSLMFLKCHKRVFLFPIFPLLCWQWCARLSFRKLYTMAYQGTGTRQYFILFLNVGMICSEKEKKQYTNKHISISQWRQPKVSLTFGIYEWNIPGACAWIPYADLINCTDGNDSWRDESTRPASREMRGLCPGGFPIFRVKLIVR